MKQISLKAQATMASKIKFEIVLMTPEWAMRLLGHSGNKNRTRSKAVVSKFVHTCKSGEFLLTHQGVAVDRDGILYDGQHRLAAIVDSGVPQWIVLATFENPEDARSAMLVIDRQNKRQLGDMIEILGMCNDKGRDRVAVAKIIITMLCGNDKQYQNEKNVAAYVGLFLEDFDAIRGRLPRGKYSAAHTSSFVYARAMAAQAIDALATKIESGQGLGKTEATLNKLMSQSCSGGGDQRVHFALKILRGVEACLRGEKLSSLPEQTRETLVARIESRRNTATLASAAE